VAGARAAPRRVYKELEDLAKGARFGLSDRRIDASARERVWRRKKSIGWIGKKHGTDVVVANPMAGKKLL